MAKPMDLAAVARDFYRCKRDTDYGAWAWRHGDALLTLIEQKDAALRKQGCHTADCGCVTPTRLAANWAMPHWAYRWEPGDEATCTCVLGAALATTKGGQEQEG